jgi:hypothetical protein
MKYGDLVRFDPIETVIELRHADESDKAKKLVETYVISDEMAERLASLVIPNLQFDEPLDNKGILVVGNYGTGKSHLMSVISAVAENADLTQHLRNKKVREAASKIAGKFQVVRTEIGAIKMPLRDIIILELEGKLRNIGVSYIFPSADEIVNHKTAFEEMMAAFQSEFPDQGLVMVVDELLDYLRSRNAQDIVLDLGFLREIGEVCKDLRFRFVAGVQEAIFDSQRFAFVADSLRRVNARFEQIPIASRDIKYVVAERLLQKTADQQAKIRDHLGQFTKFYGRMNEELDEFVRLFPIHPDYFPTFERVAVAEKREVLKTLSVAMRQMLDRDVPNGEPGLLAFDSYWETLSNDPSLKAVPEIRDVITCSKTLESRVENAFTRPQYKDMARRVVSGLSVHRLTTGDIYSSLGATAEELRDGLCLFQPGIGDMGGDPAEDLLSVVETTLRELHKTVSGQFLTINKENRQVFLDLKKSDDYDALIEKRAETLSEDQLNTHYFIALKQAMELTDTSTHLPGFNLWQRELQWRERNSSRQGYLFFGTPNERSTAIPVRDFYLYFVQPLDPPSFKDEKRADEVILKLTGRDEAFLTALRNYAGAQEQKATSSGQARDIYEAKSRGFLRDMVAWLREHVAQAFEVTYQGKSKTAIEWLKGASIRERLELGPNDTADFSQIVYLLGSVCLAKWFEDQAPEYPAFSQLMTFATRSGAVQDTLRSIAGGTRTRQANAVLDALELLDGDKITTANSRYANYVLDKLNAKGQGQVVNRSDLIEEVEPGVEYFVPKSYRLEPEWLVPILACMVHGGHIVVSITGNKIDATKLSVLSGTDLNDATHFKHIERPKDLNLPAIKALFDLLGLEPGLANAIAQGKDEGVQKLQVDIADKVHGLVEVRHHISGGLTFWKTKILDEAESDRLVTRLDEAKDFLESLQPFNTTGKLRNLKYSEDEVKGREKALATFFCAEELVNLVRDLASDVSYLSEAEMVLPHGHPWLDEVALVRRDVVAELKDETQRSDEGFVKSVQNRIAKLKNDYIKAYAKHHTDARLGPSDESKKVRILKDDRLDTLRRLVTIEHLNKGELTDFERDIASLRECSKLTEADLNAASVCPHCGYRPMTEPIESSVTVALSKLDDRLDGLLEGWTKNLYWLLSDPTVKASLDLLTEEQRTLIGDFVEDSVLPNPIEQDFVTAINEALKGLQKVAIGLGNIRDALLKGGSPAGIDDLKERFTTLLDDATRGKEKSKIRIVIE